MAGTHTTIDSHKRYWVPGKRDEKGRRLLECRIEYNAPEAFASYVAGLGDSSKVVIDASWNWTTFYGLPAQPKGSGLACPDFSDTEFFVI